MVAKGTVSKSSLILDGPGLPASRPSCGLRLPSGGTGHKQSHKRDKCRHGGGHRDYNSDRPRWAHRAASGNRRKKDQDKKKKKYRNPSPSSTSSSSSSTSPGLKKRQAKKQARKAAKVAQRTEDRLVAEIQKLRETLRPAAKPVTPAKRGTEANKQQFTPKTKSHLQILLSFMREDQLTHLVDEANMHSIWRSTCTVAP